MAQAHFVRVKISVPSVRVNVLRQYVEYVTRRETTMGEFLDQQVENFRASFGPEAVAMIEQTGVEEV